MSVAWLPDYVLTMLVELITAQPVAAASTGITNALMWRWRKEWLRNDLMK
jgi:hypothetical protein